MSKPEAPVGLDLFDRAMSSARQQRSSSKSALEEKRERVDAEWKKVTQTADAIKRRVATDSRIKAFNISDRLQEIMVTVRQNETTPPHFIRISRQHPDQNYPGIEAIWIRETGYSQDRRFDDAEALIREFALSLAHSLA